MAELRGKVVLVDFWTYACGNCVRTLPALKRWHERYAARGLVLIGVHTPEFAVRARTATTCEPRCAASRSRIRSRSTTATQTWDGLAQPLLAVASTWSIATESFVFHHEGEGGEDAIERAIEAALASAG